MVLSFIHSLCKDTTKKLISQGKCPKNVNNLPQKLNLSQICNTFNRLCESVLYALCGRLADFSREKLLCNIGSQLQNC